MKPQATLTHAATETDVDLWTASLLLPSSMLPPQPPLAGDWLYQQRPDTRMPQQQPSKSMSQKHSIG